VGANDVNAFSMIWPAMVQNKFQRRSPAGDHPVRAHHPGTPRRPGTPHPDSNTVLSEYSLTAAADPMGTDTVTMTTVPRVWPSPATTHPRAGNRRVHNISVSG
jgi:hypothetical protein